MLLVITADVGLYLLILRVSANLGEEGKLAGFVDRREKDNEDLQPGQTFRLKPLTGYLSPVSVDTSDISLHQKPPSPDLRAAVMPRSS